MSQSSYSRDQDNRRPLRHNEDTRKISIRTLADAIGKVSARLEVGDDDETRSVLNEAAGKLLELANRKPHEPLTRAVEVKILAS